jgi:putative nucleotide binding protein
MEKQYEEHAYVLDFLQHGKPGFRPTGRAGYRAGALIQCVGEEFFTLLEALVKEGLALKPADRVYVGKASREEVTYIIGRIGYEELTASAKSELPSTTPRMHALELIPGIGKKYMWQVINEREKKPFLNYEDIKKRTELPDPIKLITKRVMEELEGDSKYRLFTRFH